MDYIKKILSVVFFPVVFLAGSFCIQYIFVAIFNSNNLIKFRELYPDMNDIDIIRTADYKLSLSNYLNSKALLIVVITFIIFLLFFIKALKKMNISNIKNRINNQDYINIFILGLFISIFFNTFIYTLNSVVHITDAYKVSSMPFIVSLLSSGILGPILEELLFRAIVYNKLLTFNNHKKACIITSIMFSLIHFPNVITMIYTFILSFIMIYLYDRYKSLHAPIILHIAINTTINVLIYSLVKDNIVFNTLLLLISIFGIISVLKLINCNSNNSHFIEMKKSLT